jgi:hypothetical protein
MSIKIEIHIEESSKSKAASYFEYDPEKLSRGPKELKELLLAVSAKDKK